MKLLVLGGTLFLGRHVVEEALAAGYEVTTFTRGRSNSGIFPEAEHLVGDRDGKLAKSTRIAATARYLTSPFRTSAGAGSRAASSPRRS